MRVAASARGRALSAANRLLSVAGLTISRSPTRPAPRVRHPDVWEKVQAFTMTDAARVDALYDCTRQLVEHGVPGDFVECGVYRGGSSMAMALGLLEAGSDTRTLWLFDTFEGMTEPTSRDVKLKNGAVAATKFEVLRTGPNSADWCAAPLDEVAQNMRSTGYPTQNLRLVKGPVEETLLGELPDRIALLRLDTDWYASTRVEMERLYPRLSPGGVLIIDDYNSWAGARKAVDEYLETQAIRLVFFPVGGGSVMTVVP